MPGHVVKRIRSWSTVVDYRWAGTPGQRWTTGFATRRTAQLAPAMSSGYG